MSSLLQAIFPVVKPIIAMIHVFEGEPQRQIDQALEDLLRLQLYVDGVLVENYDWGYADSNLATTKVMGALTAVAREVVRRATIPVGINILPNDYEKAFRIAHEVGARFIQIDHVTGEYLVENLDGEYVPCRPVNREDLFAHRARYPQIAVLGGIHPKYYRPIDPKASIVDAARRGRDFADAVVVTGSKTGEQASISDLSEVKHAIAPHLVFVGSGLTPENVNEQLAIVDGAIVGSVFKKQGVVPWEPIDLESRDMLMHEVWKVRKSKT